MPQHTALSFSINFIRTFLGKNVCCFNSGLTCKMSLSCTYTHVVPVQIHSLTYTCPTNLTGLRTVCQFPKVTIDTDDFSKAITLFHPSTRKVNSIPFNLKSVHKGINLRHFKNFNFLQSKLASTIAYFTLSFQNHLLPSHYMKTF